MDNLPSLCGFVNVFEIILGCALGHVLIFHLTAVCDPTDLMAAQYRVMAYVLLTLLIIHHKVSYDSSKVCKLTLKYVPASPACP